MRLVKSKIQGDTLLKLFLGFRILSIGGRYGGGKTLLSVAMAYWLLGSGKVDKIVSNFPIKYSNDDGKSLKRTAIILDEAWMYITSKQSVLEYSAYLRKIDSYLILPSVFDIHYRLSFFGSERMYNLQSFGVPMWIYRWYLAKGRTRDKGYFSLLNPQIFYGTYDTAYIPFDDEGISKRLKDTIHELQSLSPNTGVQRNNSIDLIRGVGNSDNDNGEMDDFEDRISYMVENFNIEVEEGTKKIRKSLRR